MSTSQPFQLSCPRPSSDETIQLAHGGGGRLMQSLIHEIFLDAFHNPLLAPLHDGAVFSVGRERLAFTTDSYVVRPLFFPGGNIGSLAVYGTVNDLAMCGAKPLHLSVGFILEEGISIEVLKKVVASMADAARQADVRIVSGDTKVVDRGKGDQMFINTAGIGVIPSRVDIGAIHIAPGDRILVSGDLGTHGMAVMSVREGLSFAGDIVSDSTSLHMIIEELLAQNISIHCLRDLTRGGLASALNELATSAMRSFLIDESRVPVKESVQGACEFLGLNPLYVANEGRFVIFLPASQVDAALSILQRHPASRDACEIGEVLIDSSSDHPQVLAQTVIGTRYILDLLSGEQLPRIC